MKLKYSLIIIIFIATLSCAQEPLPEVAKQTFHYNHEIFEENKLAPRATFFGFESTAIKQKENSKRFYSLNGSWKFNWVKDPKQRPKTFQNVDFDDSGWSSIPVPANWDRRFGGPR